MNWFIYILSSILVSFLIANKLKEYSLFYFLLFLIILLTPAQIEVSEDHFAPAIFTFFYNVLLEKDYSLRVLRPLLLSSSGTVIFLLMISFIRKRFF